jgi:hypothetical protein
MGTFFTPNHNIDDFSQNDLEDIEKKIYQMHHGK